VHLFNKCNDGVCGQTREGSREGWRAYLAETTVGLTRKAGNAPAGHHTLTPMTLRGTDGVNVLILGENRVHTHILGRRDGGREGGRGGGRMSFTHTHTHRVLRLKSVDGHWKREGGKKGGGGEGGLEG